MTRYKCTVFKHEYYTTVIEIEADNPEDAAFKAEDEAKQGEHSWNLEDGDFDCMPSDVQQVAA